MKDVSKDVANSASSLAAPLSVLATDQLGWLTSVTPPLSRTSTAQLLIKTNSALPSIDWLSARNGLRVTRIVFRLKRR